jgi:hypothetical protein
MFKQDGTPNFVHLGNCPKVMYTTAVTTLPHFSVMAGTRVQDFSVILQKGGKMAVTMEERTLNNLLMFFLGAQLKHTSGNIPEMAIYGQLAQISGEFKFIATNDVGPRWYFDLTRVLIAPTGGMEFIDETAYGNFVVEMVHVVDDSGSFGTMSLQPDISTIPPENVMPPFIVGSLGETTEPFAPAVGEVLTCNIGGWVGKNTTTFQWLSGGTPVGGQTTKEYTTVSGDAGKTISCQVVGTNFIGSTTATTAPTLAVL